MRKFIFDVDGTLTPSRQKMDNDFSDFFESFCKDYPVYLVTGSDKPKTIEQIGEKIFNLAHMSFNCAGNEVWVGDELIHKNDWSPSEDLVSFLEDLLSKSEFGHKAGHHIEFRNGMINFSIVGRKCTYDQRQLYKLWDEEYSERKMLANALRSRFDNIDVNIGGETGLDIFRKGGGKSQSISKIRTDSDDILHYFGDQIFPGGNDFDAAILCDYHVQVKEWTDTYDTLVHISELMK